MKFALKIGSFLGKVQFSSVQSLSNVWLFAIPWTAACQASLSITDSGSLLKLMSIESVMDISSTISSSVVPFASRLQSFPASGSFQMSQFFALRGQTIGTWASPSVLPMNIQDWFPLGLIAWISLQPKGLSRIFSNTTVQKCQFFSALCSAFFIIQLLHPYIATGKTIALTRWTFVDKVISLVFNMPSRFVIAFLPMNKHVLISWL